ncbi:hypothetical protein [uncultured Robinsoniella sp.]|uniref:hypothetical protein n=1 Tax=uncultured Robinsoniella sp. TaxID=904190 RepID=UPI00374E840C
MEKSAETQDLNMNALVNNLLKQLEVKDRQMEQLNQTIANLTETINEMKRKIFGISSEKSSNVLSIDGQAQSVRTAWSGWTSADPRYNHGILS